jgi:UDP-2,3-diacylglucosamine pyrophosphatase LpxH
MVLRKPQIVVISDAHLGTYGCRAKELHRYLKSIDPEILVLNGDIIDIWQFSKKYWPAAHMKVVRLLLRFVQKGKKMVYITGNHDEMLRKFEGFELGNFSITNKLLLELDNGKKAWFFHGDVFDVCMQHSKWLARLGAIGYDTLILINSAVNWISKKLGGGRISLSKRIKNSVKSAVSFIGNFEQTCADIAIRNKYDYVVCGHIHQPEMRSIENEHGSVYYLNSGDWVENLSALEYSDGAWNIVYYDQLFTAEKLEVVEEEPLPETEALYAQMLQDFGLKSI